MTTAPLYRPHPQQFRTGDLVWVKRDDQFIYFNDQGVATTYPTNVAKGARLALQNSAWSDAQRQQITHWKPDPLHADIWVGHMGMVYMHLGQPWVLDATPNRHQPKLPGQPTPLNPPGVAAQPYAVWLTDTDHTSSHVWHGRVRGLSTAQTHTMLDYAHQQIGKAYRFLPWGFASGHLFYCSELIWCAVREASGIALDDIHDTLRVNWFTPWMAMKSPHMELLYTPPDRRYGL